MTSFPLRSDFVSLAVTSTGGHLSDVVFAMPDGRRVRPMHTAPWASETLAEDTPAILKVLRGDFFCAPFGSSDILPDANAVHGLPANGDWRLTTSDAHSIDALLAGTVQGATVTKHVEVRAGERMVYQRHTLASGSGRIPVGHHAMLHADHPLKLSFSPWKMALSTPKPDEVAPLGRSLLQAGQTIADLKRARRADGSTVDLTSFPSPEGFEAIWMLVADPAPAFGWTAASNAEEGWVWFALKNQRVLPQTLIWFSNGGRDYAPWNGRHRNAIGLEEICGYFHLGHAASTAENPVSASGSPTAIKMTPDAPTLISYMFGVAPAPADFGRVADIVGTAGGVNIVDDAGRTVFARCDVAFVTGRDEL
ncbi:MAG: hypothetical protein ABL879_03275 [Devosia sp.]